MFAHTTSLRDDKQHSSAVATNTTSLRDVIKGFPLVDDHSRDGCKFFKSNIGCSYLSGKQNADYLT